MAQMAALGDGAGWLRFGSDCHKGGEMTAESAFSKNLNNIWALGRHGYSFPLSFLRVRLLLTKFKLDVENLQWHARVVATVAVTVVRTA
jgi:hypothetical protein